MRSATKKVHYDKSKRSEIPQQPQQMAYPPAPQLIGNIQNSSAPIPAMNSAPPMNVPAMNSALPMNVPAMMVPPAMPAHPIPQIANSPPQNLNSGDFIARKIPDPQNY